MTPRAARCGNDPRGEVPAVEVEYAVRAEHGVIIPRASQALAQRTVDGILSHGGEAVLVSRTVVRSEWAEVDAYATEQARVAAEFGVRPEQITLRGCGGPRGEEWGDD